jgi:glycosyltransferase involved in cell wall biosynthesis
MSFVIASYSDVSPPADAMLGPVSRSSGVHEPHDVAFHVPNVGPLLHPGAELPTGGAETQIVVIARELARRGLRVAIVVNDPRLPSTVDGIDLIYRPPLRSRVPGVRSIEVFLRILRVVRQANAPVVVQCNASVETGHVGLATRLTGRRFVFHTVNVVDFDFARIEPSRVRVAGYKLGVRLAHEVVAQTAEQVRLSEERFGRPARLAVCVSEPAPLRRSAPDAFLWVGRLAWYKRPHAYLDLAEAVPEARFRMVGVPSGPDGPRFAAELAERARRLDNVELAAPRPRAELGDLYDSAVAVVNTADFEGMPNIFLEGWARGAPALAEIHDPDGMIVREGLGLFADGDPALMAQHARSLWASRHNMKDLEARCVAYMREHHSLDAIIDIWADIVGGHGPTPGREPRDASSPPYAADAADA